MASFSVSVTDIKYAGDRTGYKDIYISNAPAGGVSLNFRYTSHFQYTVQQANTIYRISTKTVNETNSKWDDELIIYNTDDPSDSVSINLVQYRMYLTEIVEIEEGSKTYGALTGSDLDLYSEYNSNGDIFTVYMNAPGTTTISDSWISEVDHTTTDTGFDKYRYSVGSNYGSFRKGYISYNSTRYVNIYQNAYPSSSSGCTSPIHFDSTGGNRQVTLKTYLSANNVYTSKIPYTGNIVTNIVKTQGTGEVEFLLTGGSNNTGASRKGTLRFSEQGYYNNVLGFTNIYQDASGPTLTVYPSTVSFSSPSSMQVVSVAYDTSLTTNASSRPSWLDISSATSSQYVISTSEFTTVGSTRSWNWQLQDANMSLAVPITQTGPDQVELSISPSSSTVSSVGGYVDITVTATGMEPSYTISGDFITYYSKAGDVWTFHYDNNNTSVQRTGTITFYGGGLSETFTLTQNPVIPVLTVSPSSQNVTADTGQVNITVTYSGLGGAPTATSSDNWLGVGSHSGSSYIIWYSQNTGTARTGTITFTGGGLTETFTLNQAATTSYITVSPSTKNLTNESGAFTLIVDTNVSSVSVSVDTSGAGPWLEYTGSGLSGFYNFSYTANTGQVDRSALIRFSGDNISADCYVEQARTLPAAIWVSPSTGSVSSSSGSVTVAVTTQNVDTVTPTISGSWITQGTISGDDYTYDYTANASSVSRTGTVTFSGNGASATYTLTQEGYVAPTPILSVTPTSDSVTAESGSVTIMLRTQNVTSVTYSNSYPWIHYVSGSELNNIYVFSYDANTGAARTGTITFTATGPGGSTSRTYTLSQAAGEPTPQPVLVIDPTSQTVDYHTRLVRITVYTENIDTVTYTIQDTSWLHFSSIPSPGQYSFVVDENTGSSSRNNTVTFTGGGLSRTYALTQTGTTPPTPPTPVVSGLKTSPESLRYYSTSSTQTVSFNMPVDEVTYSITYTDGQDWLSTSTAQNGINFTASANTGNKRSATIRFYEIADPTNYVDVPVIQGSGSVYWDSIWVENIFTPNVQDDYHYNITISNPHFNGSFEGLTPIPYQGIDVPRLVEDYISSSFEPQVGSADWASMYTGYCIASIYNLNQSTPVLEGTYSFWNDWSGKEKRYDYTKSINDPINHKGTSGMIIPFCVYADSNDNPSFSTLVTDMEGNSDTYTYSTPLEPFNMRTDVWYNVKNVDYRLDDKVLFSYDMTHCGGGAFIYRNRFGGWDSFLIEGNISKTDNYTKLNYKTKGIYNSNISNGYNYNEKRTSDVDIDTTYEAYTGWLSDDEAERLVFHLASSPKVYFQDLVNPSSDLIPIRMTLANAEYKKFRNGRRLVNYTILFEKAYTEKLKD